MSIFVQIQKNRIFFLLIFFFNFFVYFTCTKDADMYVAAAKPPPQWWLYILQYCLNLGEILNLRILCLHWNLVILVIYLFKIVFLFVFSCYFLFWSHSCLAVRFAESPMFYFFSPSFLCKHVHNYFEFGIA